MRIADNIASAANQQLSPVVCVSNAVILSPHGRKVTGLLCGVCTLERFCLASLTGDFFNKRQKHLVKEKQW